MKTNKKDRRYHKVKKYLRDKHYNQEEETILSFDEQCLANSLNMGKKLPYYYGKRKEASRKIRYSKRKDIQEKE